MESISIVDSIQSVYFSHILATLNPRHSREDESGRTSRKNWSYETRRDVPYLCASHPTTLLLYYTNMHVHRHARARAKGTKLDLQTKLDPRRLSPFFPGTRRVAGLTPVVLNIRLSRALIVQIKSTLVMIERKRKGMLPFVRYYLVSCKLSSRFLLLQFLKIDEVIVQESNILM